MYLFLQGDQLSRNLKQKNYPLIFTGISLFILFNIVRRDPKHRASPSEDPLLIRALFRNHLWDVIAAGVNPVWDNV